MRLSEQIMQALQGAALSANHMAEQLDCARQQLDPVLDGLLDVGLLKVVGMQGENTMYTACGQPLPAAHLPDLIPQFLLH